jgi:CheY-like chemotaxis protein
VRMIGAVISVDAYKNAEAALRETDRRKDEFLAMLAHELRNPLAPLRNGLQVLNLIGSKDEAAQKTREMMGRQVESLVRLVDDLLDVSRVSRGKLQLHKRVVDLKVVVLLAVENCRAIIDDRRHELQLSLPEAPLPVEVDPLRLSQVVVNLLNNAAKFTPRGGRIGLTIEPGADASEVVLRVRDNGIGIAPEMLPQIFDLFIQADPTVSRAEGGLGIGLTLVRSLVEMHGGRLHAASDGLGRGCEITVRLPLFKGESEPAAPPEVAGETPAPTRPALRILVVDDNRDAGESLTDLLRLLGHDVRQEWDGPQAVAAAVEFLPDLILLDLGMPGMSGFEVAEELRSRPALQKARLVALTGYGSPEDRSQSQAAGFHHHLVKPVELAVLEPILASIAAG